MPDVHEPLTRRAFLAGSLVSSLGSRIRSAQGGEPAARKAPRRADYFDVHIHLTDRWYGSGRGPVTADYVLRWMDAHDIAQAAILPLVSPEAFWYPVSTEFVLRETKNHRDRLVPFCAIDPRTLATHLTSRKQVVEMLNRYRDAGARGFGEHKARLPIDNRLNMRLYEACAAVQLPVLFHLDNQANQDKPGLPGLERVLKSFPELVMIGHGKGWWASISGDLQQPDLHVGYPQGRVKPGGAIDVLMEKYPNLYGDLSSSGAHAIFRDPPFGRRFLERRAGQLLFGTDLYDLHQQAFQQFELFRQFPLPDEVRAKIARGNAHRLLGFEKS
jgi:hypothetical protein